MIELKKCCKVPFPEKLFEEYEIKEAAIYANVNASKVIKMMKHFSRMHNELMFFILELPCKNEDEITSEKTLTNTTVEHDVYFIDGLKVSEICKILDSVGNFLVKDGMNTFGIGGHESKEEILFGKYNVMTIYTKKSEDFKDFLDEYNIRKTDNLITAWDTFNPDNPGECELYRSEETGKTVYDIPEIYKEYGMYLYETRKEYDEEAEKEITLKELAGKVLLIGITYYTHDNKFIEQKQFYGTVTEANENVICIKQKNGEEFHMPSDLQSTVRAKKGEYKLRSTGEVVVNPDFLATWNLYEPEKDD